LELVIVFVPIILQDPYEDIVDFASRGGIDKNLRKIICPKINFEVWKL
jgi:hypothetical protein